MGPTLSSAPTRLDDLSLLKVIGKGSCENVLLVQNRHGRGVYAMKTLRKDQLLSSSQVAHAKTELNVLKSASHPFIVRLHYAFQSAWNLYIVMEYCPGGELFFHLSRAGRFSERRCRFYAAEILLAIEYLHTLGVIYRDLKAENVLIDAYGHVKLADFGLSKEGITDNYSATEMVGTAEYLAPEILKCKGHGRAVDWYSLGALIYEMLTGLPPYYSHDQEKIFERICHGGLSYPSYISMVAMSLMQSLLQDDPDKRLGGGPCDGAQVKAHPFFNAIVWEDVMRRRLTPPFRPSVRRAGDVRYVDKQFLDLPVMISEDKLPHDRAGGDFAFFEGFTYPSEAEEESLSDFTGSCFSAPLLAFLKFVKGGGRMGPRALQESATLL